MKKKSLVTVLALVLIFALAVGGTIAWLTAKTDSVTNTFTVGDINITLEESKGTITDGGVHSFKMVPGNTIEKDPTITVAEGSEPCWLFVKVEKSANFNDFMTYSIAGGWTELTEGSGVYYREVDASAAAKTFAVLTDNNVTVKTDVTKADMEGLTEGTLPTLTFTAYAVQKDNIATAEAAWAEANK